MAETPKGIWRWLRWRRVIAVVLCCTAIGMWMDLNHIRPWAYLLAPSRVANRSAESANSSAIPITLKVQDRLVSDVVAELQSAHGFRVEFGADAKKLYPPAMAKQRISFEAQSVPLEMLLLYLLESCQSTAFQLIPVENGFHVSVWSQSSPGAVTRVHTIVDGPAVWLAQKPVDSTANQVFLAGALSPNFTRLRASLLNTSYFQSQFYVTQNSAFPTERDGQLLGGAMVQVAPPRVHRLMRALDRADSGAPSGRVSPQVYRSADTPPEFDAKLREIGDFDFRGATVHEAIEQLLDEIPFVIGRLGDPKDGAMQRKVDSHFRGVSRYSALRLVLSQNGQQASVCDGVIFIGNRPRIGNRASVQESSMGDFLAEQTYRMLPAPGDFETRRVGNTTFFVGDWQWLRQASHSLDAAHEAWNAPPGELFFAGSSQERRILRALLEPTKPLDKVGTAGELADSLRRAYGFNVHLHPAHRDKRLVRAAINETAPLFKTIDALLPTLSGGEFQVRWDSLRILMGGENTKPTLACWRRVQSTEDENLGVMLNSILNRSIVNRSQRGDVQINEPHGLLYASVEMAEALVLKRTLQLLDQPPGRNAVKLMDDYENHVYGRKYILPVGMTLFESLSVYELLPDIDDEGGWRRHGVETSDGLFVTGPKKMHERLEQIVNRWDSVEVVDPLVQLTAADPVVRHKAGLMALESVRLDPSEANIRPLCELLSNASVDRGHKLKLMYLLGGLGSALPNVSGQIQAGFKIEKDRELRREYLGLMFQIGIPAQGALHELAPELRDSEAQQVASFLQGRPSERQRDWLPLMIRINARLTSRYSLQQIIDRLIEQLPERPLPDVPNIDGRIPTGGR